MDVANRVRTLDTVRKRGRWQSAKSVARYEKSGRLQDTWRELNDRQKNYLLLCVDAVEQVVLHGKGAPPAPAGLGA